MTRWLHLLHDQTFTIYKYILFPRFVEFIFPANLLFFSLQTGRLHNNKYMLLLRTFTAFFSSFICSFVLFCFFLFCFFSSLFFFLFAYCFVWLAVLRVRLQAVLLPFYIFQFNLLIWSDLIYSAYLINKLIKTYIDNKKI